MHLELSPSRTTLLELCLFNVAQLSPAADNAHWLMPMLRGSLLTTKGN